MEKMKSRAMVLTGIRQMEMQEFDIPEVKADDGVLKVEMVGVCGSDPGFYSGKTKVPFPLIMGHEIVGRIYDIGEEKAKASGVKKGDLVVVENRFGCGKCRSCIIGDYAHCTDRMGYGVYYSCANKPHLFGAYSQYLYLPPRAMIHKIDESVPLEAAVLTTSVLGNNIRWLREVGQVSIGDTVVIAGAGQQGLAGTIVAKEAGAANIIVMGTSSTRSKKRLELAKEFGATHTICVDKEDPVEVIREITNGAMADVYMDVSGQPHNVEIASDLLRFHGNFVLPGLYGQHFPKLDLDKIVQKEINMYGVLAQSYGANEAAVKIIESRKYPIEKMVTHWFELEDAEKAVLLTGGEIKDEVDPIKCVICPNGIPEGRKATKL